ncbi:MAG: response regulator [Candidatus Omnitrophota bacterium]|nr:response regulator [Candidatus Omnitrophota bacterium]MBU1894458.1 response regulator [Candidatus Omnitrophota bacterium]
MKNKILLLIEDELDLAEVTKMRLEKEGYKVLTVPSGEAALDLIQKNLPDLILLDLLLLGMRGEELCRKLKSNDRLKTIPVILFTASVSNIPEVVKNVGADGYIMKPFDPTELIEKIKKLIGK